jgi:phosphoesterase RecJ-like protein
LRLGKSAVVCSAGPFKRKEVLEYEQQFADIGAEKEKNAKVIIVDCASMERTGSLQETLEKYPFAVIDHHDAVTHSRSTEEFPVYASPDSPSCALLIEKLITAFGQQPTKEEARLILFGLCTDTGFFRHLTERDADVLETAARMMRYGASPKMVYEKMNGGKSLKSRILTGHVLSRTEEHFNGRLLISYETLEDFKTFGLEARDSDSINKMLQSVDGVEATAVIRQESEDNCTVSFRSIDKIDVARAASSLGGGGHKNASGLAIKGNISNVKQIILKTFSKDFF